MNRSKIDYGIDLGTTNSSIVRMEEGVPKIKKSDTLKDTMPSCVSFNKKKSLLIGERGSNLLRRDRLQALKKSEFETNTFIEFKRTMGTDKEYYSKYMEQGFSSEELSAEVLKKLKSFITDEDFSSVIITVPAKFTSNQIDATQRAANLAGFNYCELLQEPIAASMAYGLTSDSKDGFWLVFDLGGGTFDAALLKVDEGIMKVVDTAGDNHLGGKDIDYCIVDNLIIPYLKKEYSIESRLSNEKKYEILRNAMKEFAEEVKIQLSFSESYDLLTDLGMIPGEDDDGEEFELDLTITRADFKEAVESVFQRAIDISKNLLDKNNLKGENLQTLILVGGPTHSPVLRTMLKEQITSKINHSIDPMTAVATGAALFASTKDIPTNHQSRDRTKIQLEVKYEATTVELEEYITVKVLRSNTKGQIPQKMFLEIVRQDKAWSSGKNELEGDVELVEVLLNEKKPNGFSIKLFDEFGTSLPCEPNQLTIIQGGKVGKATLPMTIGIQIRDSSSNKLIFNALEGLEKNQPLPAKGKSKTSYRTQTQIRPGNSEDVIKIPLYEAEDDADGKSVIYCEPIYEAVISGADLPSLLPVGSELEITLEDDESRRKKMWIYFPYLDETVEIKIPTDTKQEEINARWLDSEINGAKQRVSMLSSQSNTKNIDVKEELEELENLMKNGRTDYDNKKKVLDRLRENMRKIEAREEKTEWPSIVEELTGLISSLEVTYEQFGNDKHRESLNQLQEHANTALEKKDKKIAKELIEIGRSLGLDMMQTGAPGALELSLLRGFNDDFDMHEWSDRTEARRLINEGIKIMQTGNISVESLRPIIRALYDLLPNVQEPISGESGYVTN